VQSQIQEAWLKALEAILRPVVKLWLQSGLGYGQFETIAKSVFIGVATNDYQSRGRPANYSQVSAITGISRKEVSRIRKAESPTRWTPSMETSPVNTILHQWHFDPEFSDANGSAHPLPYEGQRSFSELVARYGGDIPPGAMRSALQKMGIVSQNDEGLLSPTQSYTYARAFDADFVRGLAFSFASLGTTLVHNTAVAQRQDLSVGHRLALARLERTAWSEHLTSASMQELKQWVDESAPRFLEQANQFIGRHELPRTQWATTPPRAVGVGVYFFQED
jgi:hypothetical protein